MRRLVPIETVLLFQTPALLQTPTTRVIQMAPNRQQNGAKGRLASVLINEWKDRIEEVEGARATETWNKIVEEVNKGEIQKL